MKLDENAGGLISQEQAKKLIKGFNDRFSGEIKCSFIGGANINKLLKQDGCVGLRIYNGYSTDESKMSLVIVGVGTDGEDLLEKGLIYDELIRCPDYCPKGGLSIQ